MFKLKPRRYLDSSQTDLGVLLAVVHGEWQNPSANKGRLPPIPILSTTCRVNGCALAFGTHGNNPHFSYHLLGLFPTLVISLDKPYCDKWPTCRPSGSVVRRTSQKKPSSSHRSPSIGMRVSCKTSFGGEGARHSLAPATWLNHCRSQKAPWCPSFSLAVRILLLVRFSAAMYSNIQDCDEGMR